jgi:hypothetical protein
MQGIAICRQSSRALIVLSISYFGLFALGFNVATRFPHVHRAITQDVKQQLSEGALSAVRRAYASGSIPEAILLTFTLNLILGAFVFITLPSLLVSFAGVLTGSVRALVWGISIPLSVISARGLPTFLLVLILVALEGGAYVVAMLASFVHGRAVIFPASVGATTRCKAYKIGLATTGHLYVVVALLLAIAATYEVLLWRTIYR